MKARHRRSKNGTYKCKVCNEVYLAYHAVHRHFKLTHDLKEFRCKYAKCVESFDTEQTMTEHFEQTHKQIQCVQCNRMVLQTNIVKHIEENHSNNSAMCELCGKVLSNKYTYQAHMRTVHTAREETKMQCDICKQL